MTKPCTKCERDLPLGAYTADKRRPNGVTSQCKDCKRAYRRENHDKLLATQRERRARKPQAPEKKRAWNAVYWATKRSGTVDRPEACEACGSSAEPVQAHHYDYDKPLDVVWACQPCHARLDDQRRAA